MATVKTRLRTTETARPPGVEGRHKTVFSNAQECAHRWAANQQHYGKAGNVYFDRGIIYSYGNHFPMARHVRRGTAAPFVLFTTRSYSSTTSGHKSTVRHALQGQTVYEVDNVLANSRTEHEDNVHEMGKQAAKLLDKSKRARADNREWYVKEAGALVDAANCYAFAVGINLRLPAVEELATWSDEQKAAAARAEKRHEIERRRKLAKSTAEWEQKLGAWRDGGEFPGHCPDSNHPLARHAFLRVRGSRLETSMRVVVPLASVLPILEMVRQGVAFNNGENAANEGEKGLVIDGFELRYVSPVERLVVIGCHRVTFDEIERVALAAGL